MQVLTTQKFAEAWFSLIQSGECETWMRDKKKKPNQSFRCGAAIPTRGRRCVESRCMEHMRAGNPVEELLSQQWVCAWRLFDGFNSYPPRRIFLWAAGQFHQEQEGREGVWRLTRLESKMVDFLVGAKMVGFLVQWLSGLRHFQIPKRPTRMKTKAGTWCQFQNVISPSPCKWAWRQTCRSQASAWKLGLVRGRKRGWKQSDLLQRGLFVCLDPS